MSKEYLTYENKILGQEIERLAKEVEKLEKVNQMLLNSMVTEAHTKETKEIERLNNIIELALDYLDNGYCYCKDKKIPKPYFDYQELVNILKGSDKE